MINFIKRKLLYSLEYFGLAIIKKKSLEKLNESFCKYGLLELLINASTETRSNIIDNIKYSKSQFLQDIFAISVNNFKKNGYFVEFGATDGVFLSNTYMLEKTFGWTGILVEPSKQYQDQLNSVRNCHIDERCVYSHSGQILSFDEVETTGLSQLNLYKGNDGISFLRKKTSTYDVVSISLIDLLDFYNAPSVIDYLSIDVEGGEYDILKEFNFLSYKFKVITVEHNNSPMREKIYNLLSSASYKQVFLSISGNDDWYIYEGA